MHPELRLALAVGYSGRLADQKRLTENDQASIVPFGPDFPAEWNAMESIRRSSEAVAWLYKSTEGCTEPASEPASEPGFPRFSVRKCYVLLPQAAE